MITRLEVHCISFSSGSWWDQETVNFSQILNLVWSCTTSNLDVYLHSWTCIIGYVSFGFSMKVLDSSTQTQVVLSCKILKIASSWLALRASVTNALSFALPSWKNNLSEPKVFRHKTIWYMQSRVIFNWLNYWFNIYILTFFI